MAEDIHAEPFGLPEAFESAFVSAHGRDARMQIVDQFFEREEIALGAGGALELETNDRDQVYLVGSTSLIHIEHQGPAGTCYVVQPVVRKRGTIASSVLEDKIVGEIKKGRKLWLLKRKVPSPSRSDAGSRESAQESDRLAHEVDSCALASDLHPDEILSETSSSRISAVGDVTKGRELDLKAFGELRTMLQTIRLQFWNGDVRYQATESLSVAAQKAEELDISGAIQSIEMVENVFVRLVEQWEHDFREAERRVRRGHGQAGDLAKIRTFKNHHLEMQSRITQTKTKFRIMLNWLRDTETKMKRGEQGG